MSIDFENYLQIQYNAREFAKNFVLERQVDKLETLYHKVLNR